MRRAPLSLSSCCLLRGRACPCAGRPAAEARRVARRVRDRRRRRGALRRLHGLDAGAARHAPDGDAVRPPEARQRRSACGGSTRRSSGAGTARGAASPGFVYTKRVTGSTQGRWYRAVVRFRWYDADGERPATARGGSRSFCHQPDQRPNLELVSLGASKRGRYLVTIVNTGLTAAPGVDGRASSRGRRRRRRARSRRWRPGERTTVVVEAEPCEPGVGRASSSSTAARRSTSPREDDNRVESDCPSADRLD